MWAVGYLYDVFIEIRFMKKIFIIIKNTLLAIIIKIILKYIFNIFEIQYFWSLIVIALVLLLILIDIIITNKLKKNSVTVCPVIYD